MAQLLVLLGAARWRGLDIPMSKLAGSLVPGRTLRGAAARAAGRRALAWAGYPNVEAGRITRAGTGRSQTGNLRRRQVRLDVVTDARLDDLATKTGRKPADIMRSAISAYLDAAGDTTVYLRDKSRER